jgi:hypothetical protein
VAEDSEGYDCGPLRYVNAREGWEALLDCERLGARVRDRVMLTALLTDGGRLTGAQPAASGGVRRAP